MVYKTLSHSALTSGKTPWL
jgi:hypothetical protein